MQVNAQNQDYPPPNVGHIQDIKREVHRCVYDSNGNGRWVKQTDHWQVLTVGKRVFAKCVESFTEKRVFQRGIMIQSPLPVINQRALFSPAYGAVSAVPMRALVNALPVMRALTAMSVGARNGNPQVNVLPFIVQRSVAADDSMGRLMAAVVKVVQLFASGETSAADLLSDQRQQRIGSHSGSQDGTIGKLHSRLLSELLSNNGVGLTPEHPDDLHKALECLPGLEKTLILAGKEGSSALVKELQQAVGLLAQRNTVADLYQGQSSNSPLRLESLNPQEKGRHNSVSVIDRGDRGSRGDRGDRGQLLPQVKPITPNNKGGYDVKSGERQSITGEKNSSSEAGRPELVNKSSANNAASQRLVNQGVSTLNQSLNVLTSNLAAAIQPPPVMETGHKQLPPIILPNANHGLNNRSERKKTRKEMKEEEEKERKRPFYPFDDEDSLEPDDE